MNKKAQLFALYLVVLTLLMIFISVWIYSVQQSSVGNALVSPASVLLIKDEQVKMEFSEKVLLYESFSELSNEFSESNFEDKFETVFCSKFVSDEGNVLRNFFFSDIFYEGRDLVTLGNLFDTDSSGAQTNFCKSIYDFKKNGNSLKVIRSEIIKKKKMTPLVSYTRDEIVFPVTLDYNYSQEYLITYEDDLIKVREVE